MAFPSAASDGFMHNGSERPAPGEKRRAGNLPVLASSAADKRVTRQRSDSGVSGISTATGPDLGRAFPGLCAGHSSTPTSRARLDVSAAAERAKDAELHSLLESSVTNACDARSNTLGARSPCATGSLTFHSISRHASGGVKCEEELDDHDEELRPEETAQSRGSHKVDSLPQWRQPSGPATELCTPKFGAPAASDSHRLSPTESCAEAPSALRGAAYEQCGNYEEDILRNLQREEALRPRAWGYLGSSGGHQNDIVADHRRILINWLVEFADEFRLERETLFLGNLADRLKQSENLAEFSFLPAESCFLLPQVAILDEFLRHGPYVKKGTLQLLGTASMVIAVKFQEAHPPSLIQSCCSVADGSFTQSQVINAEALVLRTIRYNCAIPTTLTFLWHHLKQLHPDNNFEKLAEYFALLSLSDYSLLKFLPSALSAASVLLGGVILGREPNRLLANALRRFGLWGSLQLRSSPVNFYNSDVFAVCLLSVQMRCGHTFEDLKPIIQVLIEIHQQPLTAGHITTIRRKFAECFPPRTPISGVTSS